MQIPKWLVASEQVESDDKKTTHATSGNSLKVLGEVSVSKESKKSTKYVVG